MVEVRSDENYSQGIYPINKAGRKELKEEIVQGSYTTCSVTQSSSHSLGSNLSMDSISPQKRQQRQQTQKDGFSTPINEAKEETRSHPTGGVPVEPLHNIDYIQKRQQRQQTQKDGFSTPINETKEETRSHPTGGVPVEPLHNIDYIHGGYAGVAPLLLKDEKWMLLLQHLMPDEHIVLSNYGQQLSNDNGVVDPLKVMKWGENNPVVAAYGVLNSQICKKTKDEPIELPPFQQNRGYLLDLANAKRAALAQVATNTKRNKRPVKKDAKYPAIEWDVFVDPTIVQNVDAAIQKMEDLMNITHREVYEEEIIAANIEVDRQVARLVNRMMLAHGSATQLLVEAIGVAARYNFSRVMRSGRHLRKKIEDEGKKKRRNVFGCNQGWNHDLNEDTPQDSNDDNFLSSSVRGFTPNSQKHLGSGTKAMEVKTSAILVDRWLALFASSLKLGSQSLESIRFLVEKGKIRRDKLNKSRSFRERSSQLLRSSLSKSFDDESSSGYPLPDMDIEYQNPTLCGLFLCLGMSDPDSMNADHGNSSMAESAQIIRKILGENLRLVLDMKSRHVPARVWGRLINHLRSRNLDVEGIGSFDIDELRNIENSTSTPVTTIFFFHSAGDLQRAIHANEIKRGDTVYFNAGSLFKKKRNVCEYPSCWSASKHPLEQVCSDINYEFELMSFQPYAYPIDAFENDEDITECKASLADYQKYFDLNIGLYVQEFSIGSEELDVLVRLVNKYPSIYRCGLAWGGLNGIAIKGVKGDGFWSQRYVGRKWTLNAAPAKNMTLIAVEDHHAVQKAIMYGACGQVTTVNHFLDEEQNLMCENPNVLGFTQTGNLDIL